ncbi:MAG: twin-arginine translocase TatA/TatE family subunit [Chloroflexi bacterium]|nr:twin-arginine translocase TatA/TatE family subunit [Chloroflexota bacterium]MBM4452166.1 twin-arginine translocase TatA/TatE family subunit [Chloroflexota bacterium]
MDFLGLGPLEILLVLILGFLFIGPDKLPGIAAKAGELYRKFKKATFDLTKSITEEVSAEAKSISKEVSAETKSVVQEVTADIKPTEPEKIPQPADGDKTS